jgi:hypothetical protein
MISTPSATAELAQIGSEMPSICGREAEINAAVNHPELVFLPTSNLHLAEMTAGFACALHMHQPTIPAGAQGELIGHLQYMFEHQGEGDNHNASVFAWCYARMGEFIPDLVAQGCNPRIMLDYSGNLLWGLQQMGRNDVIDHLKKITCDRQYQPHVEWLGTMWSHAVVPSTPTPDIKLQIQAWQHHFAAIFGIEALQRVKGFSPPEMHLPNHPDVLYAYIKALKECGYRWLMVQEHSVEQLDGTSLSQDNKYLPNRLVARNSHGETISITALIKSRGKQQLAGKSIPCLVTQIADGENGGVMMNEFPRDFPRPWQEMQGQNNGVVGCNGTEYLELLASIGITESDYPVCQGVQQYKIWQLVDPEQSDTKSVENAIVALKATDHKFHMDGASWTDNLSWVQGYDNVLEPMYQLSALFHQKFDALVSSDPTVTTRSDYQAALLYNLLVQTSCFRYWGQGTWTEYAQELYRRGLALVS